MKLTKVGKPCPIHPTYRLGVAGPWFCHVHANRFRCTHIDGRPPPVQYREQPKTIALRVSPDQEALINERAKDIGAMPWQVLRACIALGLRCGADPSGGADPSDVLDEAVEATRRMIPR